MQFQITGLPIERFKQYFGLADDTLAGHGILRRFCDKKPGFPCRISLSDADIGESVLLLNYEHLAVSSPYRSTHAIYIREAATEARLSPGEVPELLRLRLLSIRAFNNDGMMVGADVVSGRELESTITQLLADDDAAYLHVHNAKQGCYVARVDRWPN